MPMLMFNTWVKAHIAIVYEFINYFILCATAMLDTSVETHTCCTVSNNMILHPYNLTSHICDFPVNGLLLF